MKLDESIQTALNEKGFGPLVVDGNIGDKTVAAIRKFQEANGLVADGVPGPRTRAKLFGDEAPADPVTPAGGLGFINSVVIRKVAPSARADLVLEITSRPQDLAAVGIDSRLVFAHFLSEVCIETGGLKSISEDLNYSAERLHDVFRKRFPTVASAVPYAHNPEKLANHVYGGRLGNNQPGDGWRYRGGGLLQNTGRENFRKAGHEDDPESLREPGPALSAALSYWGQHHISVIARRDDVVAVRLAINGGDNGLDDTKVYLRRAKSALGI